MFKGCPQPREGLQTRFALPPNSKAERAEDPLWSTQGPNMPGDLVRL